MKGGMTENNYRERLEELLHQEFVEEKLLDSMAGILCGIGLLTIEIYDKVDKMAVDQATFDAALTDFMSDLDTGLAAIQAKLDSSGVSVDLSTELAQITDAKTKFDAQVAADTTPAPEAPAEPTPVDPTDDPNAAL